MRRGSLAGPIVLLGLGVVLLVWNLRPDLLNIDMFWRYWPWLLVVWGAVRAVELTTQFAQGKVLPSRGLTGGEWFLAILLTMIGVTSDGIRSINLPDRMFSIGVLRTNYDYPVDSITKEVPVKARIVIENTRGDVRVTGTDGTQLVVNGKRQVTARDRSRADEANKKALVEVDVKGDIVYVRTNHARSDSNNVDTSTTLELTVPKGVSVETRTSRGDLEMVRVLGETVVDHERGEVRLDSVGAARLQVRRAGTVRLTNIPGNVSLAGSGGDLEVDHVGGTVAVSGEYSGDLQFGDIAKPFSFRSSRTDFKAERILGRVVLEDGKLVGSKIAGPVTLTSRSKDVELSDYTGPVTIDVQRGEVTLTPERAQLGRTDIRTESGDIRMNLPKNAAFEIKGETRRGEVTNEWGGGLSALNSKRGGTVLGKAGVNGPMITMSSDRGSILLMESVANGTADLAPNGPVTPNAPGAAGSPAAPNSVPPGVLTPAPPAAPAAPAPGKPPKSITL